MAELTPVEGARGSRAPGVRLAILLALLVGGVLVVKATPLGVYLTREGILDGIEYLRGNPWAPVAYVLMYALATTIALPGSILTLAGGALFGVFWGSIWVTIGANVGASGAFWMGRTLGRQGVESILGSRVGTARLLARLDRATRDHGFRGLLALRLIPVMPFNALNVASGLTVLRWPTYAIATAIGILPGTLIYTYFADALLSGSLEASGRAFINLLIAGVLVIALSFLPGILRRFGVTVPGPDGEGTTGAGDSDRPASGRRLSFMVPATLALAAASCTEVAEAQGPIPDHATFTELLSRVVELPRVDYASLVADRTALDAYLAALGDTDPRGLAASAVSTRIAFWVNAYNACMLSQVVDNYPIRRARSFFGRLKNAVADRPANSVWQIDDVFGREFCRVAGEDRSQDQIEHEIIRPLGDPRIHFVVNCAAVSCPPLRPVALEPETLDAQLDEAVRAVVSDSMHLRIVGGAGAKVELTRILEWYMEDFGGEEGVRRFLAPFLNEDEAALILDPDTDLQFMEYDWRLNDVALEDRGGDGDAADER